MSRRWVASDISEFLEKFDKIGLRKVLRQTRLFYHELKYASSVASNKQLRNIHAGKAFAILGTGLSILTADLSKLRGCITFGCNEIFQLSDFDSFQLDYYTVGEPYYGKFLGKRYLEDVKKLYGEIDTIFRAKNTTHLYHASMKKFFLQHSILSDNKKYFYLSQGPMLESPKPCGDLSMPVSFADGAIFLMIASAIYLGAKEIYLFGCGYTYSPVQELHFYNAPFVNKSATEKEKGEFEKKLREKYEHYDVKRFIVKNNNQYYSLTHRPHERCYERYEVIGRYSKQQRVNIFNVVPDGFESPVFEKASAPGLAALLCG